jgi:hypothetical protein
VFTSFAGLHRPVKGTKVSTVLSTPGQVAIPPSYLGIGMGGHFEGFGGCLLDQLLYPKRINRVAA